jgi:hypothetical protein
LIQVPYYEITERLPIMLVAAAIAYRVMMRGPETDTEPQPAPNRPIDPALRRALVPA